jgi:predicted site-specific integrase-resolvase
VAPRSTSRTSETPIGELVAALTVEELREVVSAAVDRHDDVERQVRLVTARAAGDLAQLRAEVDRGLRTRRFLGYRESMDWARSARP